MKLLKSLTIVVAVAAFIAVAIVLPAERGVDPTGIGKVLGLKEMGETKVALAKEAELDSIDNAAPRLAATRAEAGTMFDDTEVILPPGEGREIKLVMLKDAKVTFSWVTTRGAVNYDTHADSPTIKYHGYAKGVGVPSDSGVLTAAFDGQHGWFWRNRGADTVTLRLRTLGHYSELKRLP
jgi:hypothetical protein